LATFFSNKSKLVGCSTHKCTAILSNDGVSGSATGLSVEICADNDGFTIYFPEQIKQNSNEQVALGDSLRLSFTNIQMVPYGIKGAFLVTFTKAYQRKVSRENQQNKSRENLAFDPSQKLVAALGGNLPTEPLALGSLLNVGIILNDQDMILFFKSRLSALLGHHIVDFARQHRYLLMIFSSLLAFLVVVYLNLALLMNLIVSDNMARELGERVAAHPIIQAKTCLDGKNSPEVALLEEALAKTSYTLKPTIRVMPNDDINAFALPGGIIYVHSELIKQAENSDELVGVLAHEYGHSVHKHSLAAVFKLTVIDSLSKLFFGTNNAVDVINTIGMLNHSRAMEREADATALKVLKEMNVSTQGLKTFFYRIEALSKKKKSTKTEAQIANEKNTHTKDAGINDAKRSEPVEPKKEKKTRFKIQLPGFLSTHPHIADRIKSIPDQIDPGTKPILSDEAFKKLKKQALTCIVKDDSFFQKIKNGLKY
jgi:Zn-dependent protease with chaperone function